MNYMKIAKKLISAVLVLTLIISSAPAYSQAAPRFSDIPSGAWYENDVNTLVDKGIIEGVGNNKFNPNGSLTRAECMVMLSRTILSADDINQYKGFTYFNDVAKGSWYAQYINWGYEVGVVSGVGENKFAPNKPVQRQELAVMLYNFANLMAYSLSKNKPSISFGDAGAISTWAKSAVDACVRAGIINGSGGNFLPKNSAKRSEASAMFNRFLNSMTKPSNYTVTRKRVSGYAVKAVEFNLSNFKGNVETAWDGISSNESMGSMVERTGAKFAVNAAYFDMDDYVPNATIVKNGNIVITDKGGAATKPSFVTTNSGQSLIRDLKLNLRVTLTKPDERTFTFESVSKNRRPSTGIDATRIIFDRRWGSSVGIYVRDAIAVENGVITKVVHEGNDIEIPQNGYVLYQRSRREYEGEFFNSCQVGDIVDYEAVYTDRRTGEAFDGLDDSIASGPRIVLNGQAYGNSGTYNEEGFYAGDITGGGAARRVAIGLNTSTGKVILLTAYCSVQQLSGLMVRFGSSEAMNLDGGGSSGIYANGLWLQRPDRQLSNIIYFK